ncbi:type II toxin-antitoxin system HicB family antitoxin [Lapidilactobacillus salsurivasis]
MLATYPALFYYDDSELMKYFVHFPDFDSTGTQGKDISDAMFMASDWLGMMLASMIEDDQPLPVPSTINNLSLAGDDPFKDDPGFATYDLSKSFISLVYVDVSKYLSDMEPVKKTLTIPKWADQAGRKLRINFSQTLTEAIAERVSNKD